MRIGPLARIGPNELVTGDPAMLRRMLGVRSQYQRSDWYIGMRFDPNSDNILSQRDKGLHFALRSKMSAGVSRCSQAAVSITEAMPDTSIHR